MAQVKASGGLVNSLMVTDQFLHAIAGDINGMHAYVTADAYDHL
jgi:hypothetical protein